MDRLTDQIRDSRDRSSSRRGHADYWPTNNSPIEDYDKTFKTVLKGRRIVDLVRDRAGLVVIDLMSSTDALSTLFSQLRQPNKLGISVSLEDSRSEERRLYDEGMGIRYLTGDLNMSSTWKRLIDELAGKRADLILERGGMGVQYVPANERFYGYVLNRLWEIVSENGGVILIQCPTTHTLKQTGIRFKEWVNLLQSNGVNVVFSEGGDELGFDYASLKLVRTLESPMLLPVLR